MMKCQKAILLVLSLVCAKAILGQAQQPPELKRRDSRVVYTKTKDTNPCDEISDQRLLDLFESQIGGKSTRLMINGPAVPESSKKNMKEYVVVSVTPNLGPIGEAYAPSGFDSFKKLSEKRDTDYFYPSLYFDMSASPLLTPLLTGDVEAEDYEKQIGKVANTGLDMKWLDVTVELVPWCGQKTKCPSDALRVLELMPNNTRGGTRDSLPTQVSSAFGELAKLSEPFFPASAFDVRTTAAIGGLTVLFRNLFPPKTETFFHSFIDTPTRFGWNFKQNKTKPEEASILGLRRGIVLLQADKKVQRIWVRHDALSEWNSQANNYSRFDLRRISNVCMLLPPEKAEPPIQFDALIDLASFPALIPKADVVKILHVEESMYKQLIDPNGKVKLETGPNPDFVKKTSLEKYLGIEKKSKDTETNQK